MSLRCDYCRDLRIEELRCIILEHHSSLVQLKECAQSRTCDMCALFWECLRKSCHKDAIQKYLDGRQSDPPEKRDTRIFLQGFLADLHLGAGPRPAQIEQGSTLLVSSGEFEFSRVHGWLSVYAKPDTIAAKYLTGRLITKCHDSHLRQTISNDWLTKCQSSHKRCGGTAPQLMPTRVIDLGDPEAHGRIRLKISKGQYGQYLALSYSWGLGLRHNVKLRRTTLEPYQDYIPEYLMTQSHQEALCITRELKYRYLWIDALCIIQGDKEDWAAEALKIAQVYSNAELTIVAGRSDDSSKGFVELIQEPLVQPQAIPYHRPWPEDGNSQDLGDCFVALNRSMLSGPVDERAWCFQESVLSRRMIIYGMQQLFFKCREMSWYEDGSYMRYRWSDGGRYDLSTSLVGQNFSQEEILDRWYQLTQEYACRDVYNATDNFAALAGVASRFHDALGCRYLAGLWEADMRRALLWRSRRLWLGQHSKQCLVRPIAVDGAHKGQCIERAPSWSCLALQGPIIQLRKPLKAREEVWGNATNMSLECRPIASNNGRWSPDHWGPEMVEYLGPCRVQIHGYMRQTRCSKVHVGDHAFIRKWQYSPSKLKEHAVLLEALEDSEFPTMVAMGLFDLASRERKGLWCLCISEEEGLLLVEHGDYFRRVGVFMVENAVWFSRVEREHVTIV